MLKDIDWVEMEARILASYERISHMQDWMGWRRLSRSTTGARAVWAAEMCEAVMRNKFSTRYEDDPYKRRTLIPKDVPHTMVKAVKEVMGL